MNLIVPTSQVIREINTSGATVGGRTIGFVLSLATSTSRGDHETYHALFRWGLGTRFNRRMPIDATVHLAGGRRRSQPNTFDVPD